MSAPGSVKPSIETSPFSPGEQSIYRIRYLGLGAGTAQITVGAPIQQWGSRVWPLVTVAKSDPIITFFPIRDRFISYWHPEQNHTLGSELLADENHVRRRLRIQLEGGRARVLKQKEGEAPSESEIDVPLGALDTTSVIFALRKASLSDGGEFRLPVFTGRTSFELIARVIGKETRDTVLGPRQVFVLTVKTEFGGQLKSRREMTAYITADAARIPVLLEADFLLGKIAAELTSYLPGQAPEITPGS
ncbi:MAG: DUF3108 domain-containing protein [Myxococcaceae bacterium]